MDAVAINTMYSYAGDISHKSDKRSTSIQFLIIDTFTNIFTPLHWGFTVVTSSLSIFASFGVPLCHKYFLHQRSVRHLVPIQYCALHQKRKWRGVEGKAEGMKPLKILHEFTHILTKKRSQHGRGVSISLLMILCTHYISYTTDTNISYIALQTKLGLGHR